MGLKRKNSQRASIRSPIKKKDTASLFFCKKYKWSKKKLGNKVENNWVEENQLVSGEKSGVETKVALAMAKRLTKETRER